MELESIVTMGKNPSTWKDGIAKSITFGVTEDCNLRCTYCYMTGKNTFNKMTFETAKKAVDYILSNRDRFNDKAVIWDFIGGEPFLEIELIDRLSDYIKQQMFLLDHPWFNAYRFSFSSNGILYSHPKVQEYIKKNHGHISIGISVDGNQIKHDLSRKRPDGTGSYADVIKNVPLWLKQFPGASTKATFSHDDLPFLKDSILDLWENGIKIVMANVVFEDVWEENDPQLIESQLKELADIVIDKQLWRDYSVRFFDPHIGFPLSENVKKSNFCGAGKMLAIDAKGNLSPCVRFWDLCCSNRKGIIIGNVDSGIDDDKLRPFAGLDMPSQSPYECINCEIASGCAWCTGCNYDASKTGTVYERAVFNCEMHKATVRANKYFWDKFEQCTGLPSKRRLFDPKCILEKEKQFQHLHLLMSSKIVPDCSYSIPEGVRNEVMPEQTFLKGVEFANENNLMYSIIGTIPETFQAVDTKAIVIDSAKHCRSFQSIPIYRSSDTIIETPIQIAIVSLTKSTLAGMSSSVCKLLANCVRVNIMLSDLSIWNNDDCILYKKELSAIAENIVDRYKSNREVEVNVLTDIFFLSETRDCGAGEESITLAPNGKFYLCPAFYFNRPEYNIGDLDKGINILNKKLLSIQYATICHFCDAYHCKRCKFENMIKTNEINIPGRMQCAISHIEREVSLLLQTMLNNNGFSIGYNTLSPIDYNDPLRKLVKSNDTDKFVYCAS